MEAKELRIGNYYIDIDDKLTELSGYELYEMTIKENTESLGKTEFRPIPLTEEWLDKFGFYYGDSVDYGYLWLKCKMGEFYVRPSYLGGFYWGFDYNNEINGQNNIKHVHQLQNLYFALTNEELKLK